MDQSNTLFGILIVALIAPVVLSYVTARQARRSRKEDWARQDAVAAQAAEAAALLLAANERAERIAKQGIGKLDVIHTLVNSNMTSALQSELDATKRELAMMFEVVDLKRAQGIEPGQMVLVALKATEDRITELRTNLKDRAVAQKRADAPRTNGRNVS